MADAAEVHTGQGRLTAVPRLSIVIPAYNEAARIGATLIDIHAYLVRQSHASEIIVVDDGSADATAEIVRAGFPAVQVISYRENRGKGYAVRTGMLAAKGDIRLFFDADGSTPIDELDKAIPFIDGGADIVIGSRMVQGANVLVHQRWVREHVGRLFNVLLLALGLTRMRDTQCGFKAFTARSTEICFTRQTLDRFSFDVELLCIAQRHGLRIVEMPVRWINSPDTRVRMVRDAFPTMRDLLTIRHNLRKGAYD